MGKFRVLAKNQFGWSIPSVPSGIVMTPSSGASRAEFYDVLQQIQAREDIEDNSGPLSYECEKKPMKSRSENPGSLDFMSELGKGRFSVLQFSALPSTDVLSYISERPFYTEQDVCDI